MRRDGRLTVAELKKACGDAVGRCHDAVERNSEGGLAEASADLDAVLEELRSRSPHAVPKNIPFVALGYRRLAKDAAVNGGNLKTRLKWLEVPAISAAAKELGRAR